MNPTLFKIGSLSFPAYTFMIMIGILAATFLGVRLGKRYGLQVVYLLDMAIIGMPVGFLGARIAHVLVEAPSYYWEKPVRFFYFWQGGFVSWGAYISVLLTWYVYLRLRKQPAWAYFDIASLAVPLALFFGRIGCLMAGCCFGKPTDFFLHLVFVSPESTAYGVYPNTPLHATQIYLMVNVLLIQLTLFFIARKRWHFQGQLFSLMLGMYAVGRTLIEFLRGDLDRGVYFGGVVSSGQITMAGFFLASIFLHFYFKRKALPVLSMVK